MVSYVSVASTFFALLSLAKHKNVLDIFESDFNKITIVSSFISKSFSIFVYGVLF